MRSVLLQGIAVFYTLTLLNPGVGERFFMHRDHRDQRRFMGHKHRHSVDNKFAAEAELVKYGYLKCRMKKKSVIHKSETSNGLFIPSDSIEEFQECNDRQIRAAIRKYQKRYKLPQTGDFDPQTRRMLNSERCGNTDSDINSVVVPKETNKAKVQQTKLNTRPVRRWRRSLSSSPLMNVIAGKTTTSSLDRRRRYLHDYINKLKTDDPLLLDQQKTLSRAKRSQSELHFRHTIDNGQRFDKSTLRWRLLSTGYSTRIPTENQRATLDLAFRMWSEVIPVTFIEDTDGDLRQIDIQIAFGTESHMDCPHDFDGPGGEIAHSWTAGNIHFDDDENFISIRSYNQDGIFLLRMAVHEIGHVLGLSHTDKEYSVMYAIFDRFTNPEAEFELGWEDRKMVQQIYGVCQGSFNTVFDWVRRQPDHTFIFNTYFFRGNHYWMYENHANRTRYGDPLFIAREWNGVPNNIDAYVHIWYFTGQVTVDEAFFFKGEEYYKYDSATDSVYEGWPRLISEDFGPKPGGTHSVPSHLDSVFFDMRDKNLYFFKGDMVYVFDPKETENRGCCVRVQRISEEYPSAEGEPDLPSDLDAVYYSFKDKSMYFLKGEEVYENKAYRPRLREIHNEVSYHKKRYEKWFDICDATVP